MFLFAVILALSSIILKESDKSECCARYFGKKVRKENVSTFIWEEKEKSEYDSRFLGVGKENGYLVIFYEREKRECCCCCFGRK